MNGSRLPPADDSLEKAIEACCDALVSLEVIRVLAPGEAQLEERSTRAIASLRFAIRHLRAARGRPAKALASGFVAADGAANEEPAPRP